MVLHIHKTSHTTTYFQKTFPCFLSSSTSGRVLAPLSWSESGFMNPPIIRSKEESPLTYLHHSQLPMHCCSECVVYSSVVHWYVIVFQENEMFSCLEKNGAEIALNLRSAPCGQCDIYTSYSIGFISLSSKWPLHDKIQVVVPDLHNLKPVNILRANWEWNGPDLYHALSRSWESWATFMVGQMKRDAHIQPLPHKHTKSQATLIKGNYPEMSVPMGNLSVSVTAPHHNRNTVQLGEFRWSLVSGSRSDPVQSLFPCM